MIKELREGYVLGTHEYNRNKLIIEKINEIIREINRLGEEPACRVRYYVGKHPDTGYDVYTEKEE